MSTSLTTTEINNVVWKACDSFRGAIDPSEYKNYVLTMLFLKYLSDLVSDLREQYEEKYAGDEQRITRAMSRERFIVPPECDFNFLHDKRDSENIGELINAALEKIEDENKQKLEGVLTVDFNSEALGPPKEKNKRIKDVLEDFAELDLRPSRLGNRDIIGDVYEYLIARFAAGAGKKAGEFYTPPEVSTLLAKLLSPERGNQICDPACGSGSLLIKVAREVGSDDFFLAGQESNRATWALCKMNMFLHGMDNARIEIGDTIINPRLTTDGGLTKFDIVVANPPFSLEKWGHETAANDKFHRFWRGIPPKNKGDFAFITHMVESALPTGRVGVIVPHGVLFRGGAEGIIRQKLVEDNLVRAVIGLPPNLFYGTAIPAAIIIFDKAKADTDVLFINAAHDFGIDKSQNFLREEDITQIVETYKTGKTIPKYSQKASFDQVKANDFNLNVLRYVDVGDSEETIDLKPLLREITELEKALEHTRTEMNAHLKELGYAT